MEPTPRWVDNTDYLLSIVLTALLVDYRRQDNFSLPCMKLNLLCIKHILVELDIFPRVFHGLLNQLNSDYFLRILTQAQSNRARAAADVKEDG